MKYPRLFTITISAWGMALLPVYAGTDNLTFNGFGSIVATNVLSSDNNASFEEYYLRGGGCPCYITDYYTGGLINEDDGMSLRYESRIGLQLGVRMTDELTFTSQVVARSLTNEFTLEWAYLTYQINDEWSVQAGRKRIPLYYFSTFQDVGIAYTWVRPPQSLYGWEASNYNGLNISYAGNMGDTSIQASVYAGNETIRDAAYNSLYTDDPSIIDDSRWKNIVGFDVELTYEWLNARFIYLTSDNSATDKASGDYEFYQPFSQQRVMGLAINGDFSDWFFHLEKSQNRRENKEDDIVVKAPADMLAIGYRIGNWTPFVSWSRYWEKSDSPGYEGEAERFTIKSITLRYDINPENALKVQIETFDDASQYDFVGDTRVLSVSYDFVF
ncbi:hypothetical protein [Bowmanella sp. JS7-9]|uniref:hypothetical protein n=1 Tax=Alteromonadaceae TaxID=72275 RepID=UPI00103ADF72|nr:hypothetical protein [Bowmanella sp. JS7-9]